MDYETMFLKGSKQIEALEANKKEGVKRSEPSDVGHSKDLRIKSRLAKED